MPQIKFSGLVTAMKGKAGGSIFSQNKQGAYFRNNRWGGGRKSARWDSAKVKLSALSNQWRLLSPAQREAWQAAGADYPFENKFKEQYIPSGYQLFMSLNGNLYAQNLPLLTVPGENRPFPDDFSISVSNPDIPWVTGGTGATFPVTGNGLIKPCNEDEDCPFGFTCQNNGCLPVYPIGSPNYNALREQARAQYYMFDEPECTSDSDCVDAGLSGASTDVACQDGKCVYVGDGLVYWEATSYLLNIALALSNGGSWDQETPSSASQINGSFRFTLGPDSLKKLRTTQDEIVLISNYYNDGRGVSIRIRPQDEQSTRVYITLGINSEDSPNNVATYMWYQDFSTREFTSNSVLQFQINPGDTINSYICLNSSGFIYGQFQYWDELKTGLISSWGEPTDANHNPYANWEMIKKWTGFVYGSGLLSTPTDVIYSDIRFFPSRYTDFKYPLSGMLQGSESILITANGVVKPSCSSGVCNIGIDNECGTNSYCSCYNGKCTPHRYTADRFSNQAPGGDTGIRLTAAVPIMTISEIGRGLYDFVFDNAWLNLAGGYFMNNGATFVPLTTATITGTSESGFQFVVSVTRAKAQGKTQRNTEFINMTLLPADVSAEWELWDFIKSAIASAPPGTEFWVAFDLLDTSNGKPRRPRKDIRFKAGAELSSGVW